jgi:hypothetical protein
MSLFVMYVPATGHVVGAVNANGVTPQMTSDQPPAVDPAWLVGTALPMRVAVGPGVFEEVSLPASELKVHTPDDQPDVFANPLRYAVELSGTTPQPVLVRLPEWSGGVEFVATGLHVTVPEPTTNDTPVVAWVSDGQDTREVPGVILKGASDTTLPVTVDSGPHAVLVQVAGWAGRLEKVTAQ